jgi:hypothetical protein
MNLTPTKYSYSEFIELSIYADLKSAIKVNDRLTVSSDQELADVKEKLTENNLFFIEKSKREIWVVSEAVASGSV